MGRAAKIIDKDKLEAIIVKLESENTYTTRSQLFTEVAEKYSDLHGVSFSNACAAQRAKQFGIEIKTQMGERGLHLKGGNADALKKWRETGEVQDKKPKIKSPDFLPYWAKEDGGKFLKIAKSAQRGSVKAKIKLKCIECAGGLTKEVALCEITTCPLWDIRPYQSKG